LIHNFERKERKSSVEPLFHEKIHRSWCQRILFDEKSLIVVVVFLKHFYKKKIGFGLENFYLVNFYFLVDFGVIRWFEEVFMIFLNENSLKIFNPKNLFPCLFGHQSGGLNQDYNPVDNIQWHVVCYLKKKQNKR
jgi:hypothetical protein